MTNFPQGISSFGVPIAGPLLFGGNCVWVDSGAGRAAGADGEFDNPFPTLLAALASNKVRAAKDDCIIIKAGHSESISAAGTITVSKSGVRIIGLGRGAQRPTFNFTTATTATFLISGASVSVSNCIFTYIAFDAVAKGIEVTAADAEIAFCRFEMSDASEQATVAVYLAAGGNRAYVHDCEFIAVDAGATSAIASNAALSGVRIEDNWFFGDFSTACINNFTAAWIQCRLANNTYYGTNASEPIIEILTGGTGVAYGNRTFCATFSAGGSIVGDAIGKFENYITDTAANSGILDPTGVTL